MRSKKETLRERKEEGSTHGGDFTVEAFNEGSDGADPRTGSERRGGMEAVAPPRNGAEEGTSGGGEGRSAGSERSEVSRRRGKEEFRRNGGRCYIKYWPEN